MSPGEPALGFLLCPRRCLLMPVFILSVRSESIWSTCLAKNVAILGFCNFVCVNVEMKLEMVSFHGEKCWSLERTRQFHSFSTALRFDSNSTGCDRMINRWFTGDFWAEKPSQAENGACELSRVNQRDLEMMQKCNVEFVLDVFRMCRRNALWSSLIWAVRAAVKSGTWYEPWPGFSGLYG